MCLGRCVKSATSTSNGQVSSFAHLELPLLRWKTFGKGHQTTRLSSTSSLDSGARNTQASLVMRENSSLAKRTISVMKANVERVRKTTEERRE